MVDQSGQDAGKLAGRVAFTDAELLRQTGKRILAENLADLCTGNGLILPGADPRRHHVTQTGLLEPAGQAAQPAVLAIVAQEAGGDLQQLRVVQQHREQAAQTAALASLCSLLAAEDGTQDRVE